MNKSKVDCPAVRLLGPETDCFLGFHDVCQFDAQERYALALRIGFHDRPPGPADLADILVGDLKTGTTVKVDETTAWNFPQGARQQWWPGRDGVHVYNKFVEGRLVATARNLAGEVVATIPGGIYSFSPDGKTAYSLNFSRLHYLGGYGYATPDLPRAFEPCPDDDGIWVCDLQTSKRTLLASIAEVTSSLRGSPEQAQFVTHVQPSPSGEQLCFLHRSWLADGGVNTAVCVCARDGSGLRILGQGFYSHFDWADDETLLIWGRPKDRLHGLRSQRSALVGAVMKLARPVWRLVKRQIGSKLVGDASYLMVNTTTGEKRSFLPEKLSED